MQESGNLFLPFQMWLVFQKELKCRAGEKTEDGDDETKLFYIASDQLPYLNG